MSNEMKDPLQEIQDKLDAAWTLNEKDGFGQPDALIYIKNLLKLVKAYEEAMKDQGNPFDYIDANEIKQQIFNDKQSPIGE